MDYRKSAREVIEHIGGKDNIVSAAHCATRLRLVIADNAKLDVAAIENVDGVKGVFEASGQIQIIFGTGTVNKVYDEFIDIAGIAGGSKEEVKKAATAKQNIFKRAVKTLGDIFVPIIPAIVASGLLMGLLEGLCNVWPQMSQSGAYTIIHLFSNAAFVYLPILIAISAAKVFGGNQFLGAVIGMIMIHSDLINAWNVSGMDASQIPTAPAWFGLYHIKLVGYQGHVIPVVIAVFLMSVIEKKLHKIVPEIIDLFVTPLVTVLVTGYVTLTVIGPVFSTLENYVLTGAQHLIAVPFGIGAALCGALYAPTVVAGLHHMYNAIEIGLLSQTGWNTWMPIATAANMAQGAAALAVAVKTKNNKTKAMALPASLSAFLGITEPAIFGVNVRYMKPFVAGCIGAAAGALVAGIFGIGATAYGITGIFGFLITTHYTLQYAIEIVVTVGVAFAISWILYKDPQKNVEKAVDKGSKEDKANKLDKADKADKESRTDKSEDTDTEAASGADTVYCPINGNAVALEEVKDATFASGVLGKGFAIVPEEGKVYAPFDGTLDLVYDTKHALGMTSRDGIELLIHVGLNTVELNGAHYTAHAASGDTIRKGQLLLEFDMEAIKKAGYDVTTPVLVTNSDQYEDIHIEKTGSVQVDEKVIVVK